MDFAKMLARAKEVRAKYAKREEKMFGRSWSGEELAMGFVGDVGDLMKLAMVKERVRESKGEITQELAHELADCMWSLMVLADEYQIDLEKAFWETMEEAGQDLK